MAMTPKEQQVRIQAAQRALGSPRGPWWTQWTVVRGTEVIMVAALGFIAGVAVAGLVYSLGVWMR